MLGTTWRHMRDWRRELEVRVSSENTASERPASENERPEESPLTPEEQPQADGDKVAEATAPAAPGSDLFAPGSLGTVAAANRIVLSPLETGLASAEGEFTPELVSYLVARARGGVGLVMTEAVNVSETGLTNSRMPRLTTNDHIAGLRTLAEEVHRAGAPLAATLTLGPVDDVNALTAEELAQLQGQFAEAAGRAQTAGADAVALELGNGHLLGQLLSPASNAREDEYGGSLDNRLRLPLAVLAALRERVGEDFPLLACVTVDERLEGGVTPEEGVESACRVSRAGVQGLLITVGTVRSRQYAAPCHYVVPLPAPALAAKVKEAVVVPVVVAGGIRTVAEATEILAGGQADFVGMSRALLADPELPMKLRTGREASVVPCIGCNQACVVGEGGGRLLRCVTNPRAGFEHEPTPLRMLSPRDLVVVGGGPAGVVAAVTAAQRGFRVTLFEQETQIGGRFRLAAVPPHKALLGRYVEWLKQALADSTVKVRLGERADYETLRGLAPEVVILAGGASLDLPETIPGIADPLLPGFVVSADEVLAGKAPVGKRVMIVGARRVGLETADLLAGDGRHVIVCDSSQAPDALVPATVRPLLEERLKANKVEVLAEATVVRVRDMVVFVRQGGRIVQYDSLDTVVVACGWRRNDELASRLAEHVATVVVVGDARSPRTAMAAIREAYETVAKL